MTTPSTARSAPEWTIRSLMDWTEKHFQQKGIDSPRLEAQLLLAHALECKRAELYTRWDEPVGDDRRGRFRELIKRRLDGCPVQYLLGYREFFFLQLEVTPAVLIPRPETELLVTEALNILKPLDSPRVLDIGAGSGCIAIAIAHQHKTAKITAVDISADALVVAKRNAVKHLPADRIRFEQSDLLDSLAGELFDLIVSNPPYIAAADLSILPAHIRDFEPRLALDGGLDGFAIYDRLVPAAAAHLAPDGSLLLEIGAKQEDGIRQRIEAAGLTFIATRRDDQRLPRVVIARKSK